MTDSAETMREALFNLVEAVESSFDLDDSLAMRSRVSAARAALSASGTKSEIDEAGLERAVRECARITAPEITDAEYEAIRKGKEPRYLNTCAEMRRALIAYLGEANAVSIKPGPSDPIPSQHDEVEAIARIIDPKAHEKFDAAYMAGDWHGRMHWIGSVMKSRETADAILAMLAERRADNTVQRDRIYRAAERSNTRFGQWMPERWVNIFVEELNK